MRAVEFESTITQTGQLVLPLEVSEAIPVGEHLRVVVMWEPSTSDPAWRALGRERFEAAYSAEDSVYELLTAHDPAAR